MDQTVSGSKSLHSRLFGSKLSDSEPLDPGLLNAKPLYSGLLDAKLLDSALLDCYGRFVTLLPENVLNDHVHLCFHLQEAYWWYCDKWQVKYPQSLPLFRFKEFLEFICRDCPILQKFVTPEQQCRMIATWRDYSKKIPLRGGILLNETCDKVLLVQCYQSGQWTFPRGKTDEAEEDATCAAREILEETGLDVTARIRSDVFIENIIEGQDIKLFLVPGINEKTTLKPKTNYEIRSLKWIPLRVLSELLYQKKNSGFSTFHVKPFDKKIHSFVADFQKGKYKSKFPKEYALYKLLESKNIKNRKPNKGYPNSRKRGDKIKDHPINEETLENDPIYNLKEHGKTSKFKRELVPFYLENSESK